MSRKIVEIDGAELRRLIAKNGTTMQKFEQELGFGSGYISKACIAGKMTEARVAMCASALKTQSFLIVKIADEPEDLDISENSKEPEMIKINGPILKRKLEDLKIVPNRNLGVTAMKLRLYLAQNLMPKELLDRILSKYPISRDVIAGNDFKSGEPVIEKPKEVPKGVYSEIVELRKTIDSSFSKMEKSIMDMEYRIKELTDSLNNLDALFERFDHCDKLLNSVKLQLQKIKEATGAEEYIRGL